MQVLTERDFVAAAFVLECEVEAIKAVCQVEAPKGGFNEDGSCATLFEGHIFHKYTKGRFDAAAPTLSYPKWTREYYGKTSREEQTRLMQAMLLDPKAALMATSWGRFQIMGFNYTLVGFTDLDKFVSAMKRSEKDQLDAFIQYVIHTGLRDELQDRRWADFARLYNGPEYQKNSYDTKLEKAYKKFKDAA